MELPACWRGRSTPGRVAFGFQGLQKPCGFGSRYTPFVVENLYFKTPALCPCAVCHVLVTTLATVSEFCFAPGPVLSAVHTAPEWDTPSLAHVTGVKTEAQNSVGTCQGDVYVAGLDPGGSRGGRPWPGLVIWLFV